MPHGQKAKAIHGGGKAWWTNWNTTNVVADQRTERAEFTTTTTAMTTMMKMKKDDEVIYGY